MFEVPRYLDGQWREPQRTVYDRLGAGRSNTGQPSVYYTVTCDDPTVRLWRSGTDGWGILDVFTQNQTMGSRWLWAGGWLFLAAVFAWNSFRGKGKGKRTSGGAGRGRRRPPRKG